MQAVRLTWARPPPAGTLAYTPATGVVLGAGVDQTLSVSFAPDGQLEFCGGDDRGRDQCRQGRAGNHLGQPGGYRLRHAASRDATRRDFARDRVI